MSAPRLRLLVVMPLGAALGGGEEMLRQLVTSTGGAGVDWTIAFLRPGPLVDELRARGIACEVIAAGRFRDVGARLRAVRAIARLARARSADIVVGWMAAGQAMAGPAALLARRPCVWYQVGTPGPDWLDRVATAMPARGILVLSQDGEAAQHRVWPRRPTRLVYPGVALRKVDAARATPAAEMRARLGVPPDGPLVGMVGRLQRWKGMHVFVDAMASVRASSAAVRGVIVGAPHETEPAYADEVRGAIRAFGLEGAVTMPGFQANAIEWMQAMDVFVHASDREPFGIVVVEAMALGKPVIAGAAGGPAEIITDGVNGLLAPYGDAPALASAIRRVLADPAFAARLGEAARTRALDFGEAAYAGNVVRAIRDLVQP